MIVARVLLMGLAVIALAAALVPVGAVTRRRSAWVNTCDEFVQSARQLDGRFHGKVMTDAVG